MSEKRWMSTGYIRSAPSGKVDREHGIIEGVSVCTVGEAKGHGVNLDHEFVGRVVEFGQSRKQGLKARFGHPNMCSTALGTFLGRFKNFREVGNQAKADLFLSNEAKDTPHGNLYDYVLGMAENEPDMFGTSIVFTPGAVYRRNAEGEKVFPRGQDGELNDAFDICGGPDYVECAELHACDAVDEPAANEGLFSRFSRETVAGQITEFLDLHPEIWTAVQENPSIIEALGRYGDKVDEFVTRYRDYREQNAGGQTMTQDNSSEKLEAASAEAEPVEPEAAEETQEISEPEAPESGEAEVTNETAEDESVSAESEAAPEAEESAGEVVVPADEKPQLSHDEFCKIADEFGNDVAVQVMREGGDYQSALRIAYDQTKEAKEKAESALSETKGFLSYGKPVPVTEAPKDDRSKRLFNTGK